MARYVVRAEKSADDDSKITNEQRGAWDDLDDHPVVESVASRVMRPVKRVVRKRKAKKG